jgi:hypothetical protein
VAQSVETAPKRAVNSASLNASPWLTRHRLRVQVAVCQPEVDDRQRQLTTYTLCEVASPSFAKMSYLTNPETVSTNVSRKMAITAGQGGPAR